MVAIWPCETVRVAAPLIVQVAGVIVKAVVLPVVLLVARKVQFGTANVVAVGRAMATATEPTYSTRLGLQSVARIVSVAVVPVIARPARPGRDIAGAVAAPPEGVHVATLGTPFGVVGETMPLMVWAEPAAE